MKRTVAVRQRKRVPLSVSDQRLALLMVAPAAVLLLAFLCYPLVLAVRDGFFDVNALTGARAFVALENYAAVVADERIHAAFGRTILWTVANLVLQMVAGVAIALLLNAGLRGQALARMLVLVPYVVPAVVVALIFRFLFNDITGAANYLVQAIGLVAEPVPFLSSPDLVMWTLVAVNSWRLTPFVVIVVLARLQTVPGELHDAAAVDGAGMWQRFAHVTLPWLAPVLIVTALLRTIWSAYDYDLPYLLAFGGPLDSSTTLPMVIRTLAFTEQQIGMASALAVCMAILLLAAAYFYLRSYRSRERHLG